MPPSEPRADPLGKLIAAAAESPDAPPEIRTWFRLLLAGDRASSAEPHTPPPEPQRRSRRRVAPAADERSRRLEITT